MKPSLSLACVVAFATLAAPAFAQPGQDGGPEQPRQAVVKYDDLNLGSQRGAVVLKQRIQRAARSVCGPTPDIRNIEAAQTYNACLSHAQASAAQPMAEAMAHMALEEIH